MNSIIMLFSKKSENIQPTASNHNRNCLLYNFYSVFRNILFKQFIIHLSESEQGLRHNRIGMEIQFYYALWLELLSTVDLQQFESLGLLCHFHLLFSNIYFHIPQWSEYRKDFPLVFDKMFHSDNCLGRIRRRF